ncbi:unknown [Ruminococcus sp. CAG:563]|nr:unknown [Ruminococcus sp. CAG:563]
MNNIIEIIKVESEEENSEQNNMCRTLPGLDFIAENIERNKHNGDDSAINIWKNILAAASDCRFKRSKMVRQEIKNIVIELVITRECARRCGASLEAVICRKKRNGRKSYRHKRTEGKKQARGYKSAVENIIDFSVIYFAVLVNVNRLGRKNLLD